MPFSFVCAHLTAYENRLGHRLADYKHIVGTLLFPPIFPDSKIPSTIYSTSHLFFLGDLNFRLEIPASHPFSLPDRIKQALDHENAREELKEFDQLLVEHRKGTVFVGLREGQFWKFKCSYKYLHGEVDKYRCVFQLFLLVSCVIRSQIIARSVHRHGRIGCCMLRTPTPPIRLINPTSRTFCIPQFPPIPRQTTYASCSSLTTPVLTYPCRNQLFACFFYRHHHHQCPHLPHLRSFASRSIILQFLIRGLSSNVMLAACWIAPSGYVGGFSSCSVPAQVYLVLSTSS